MGKVNRDLKDYMRALGYDAVPPVQTFSSVSQSFELMFVGEGSETEEDLQGAPFVGKAGELLKKMILAMGYDQNSVYFTKVLKSPPQDSRKPVPNEIQPCSEPLRLEILRVKPRVIVALGAVAAQVLLQSSESIARLRGKFTQIRIPELISLNIALMPTFDPAYLLDHPDMKRPVWEDLQLVMEKLKK